MSKNVITAVIVLAILIALVLIFNRERPESIVEEEPIIPDESEIIENPTESVINLYFVNREMMAEGTIDYEEMVQPVERVISEDVWAPEEAIKLLLIGLIGEESQTFDTSIPEGVQLNSLVVEDGTALVDFSAELNMVAGSATVITLREQINKTLLQFPEIEEVVIMIDGHSGDEILQP